MNQPEQLQSTEDGLAESSVNRIYSEFYMNLISNHQE
jgi:hypothetical protein